MTDNPAVPQDPETAFARLQAWYISQQKLKEAKQEEHLERVSLTQFYFHDPREGTNRTELGGGFDLVLTHSFNYKVDVEALDAITPADIKRLKLPWDDLFVYKPSLSVSVYRDLTAEQKKFVDELLDITPGSPQLEIKASKEAKPQRRIGDTVDATAEVVEYDVVVEDMEQAKPGNFYQDADGDWWLVQPDGEWAQTEAPTNLPPPTPRPGRKPRAKK